MQKFESETGDYNGGDRVAGSRRRLTISVALLVLNVSLAFPEHAHRYGADDCITFWRPGTALEEDVWGTEEQSID